MTNPTEAIEPMQQIDSDNNTMLLLTLSLDEINANLAQRFHDKRDETLKLAEKEGNRHDRDRRS